jgi:transposase-like protein
VKSCDEECKSLCHGYRFPAAVISFAVRWYFRFQPSLRDIEELLFERGVIVIVSVKPEGSGWRQQI